MMMMMMTGATYQQALPSDWGPAPPGAQAPVEFKFEEEDEEEDDEDNDDDDEEEEEEVEEDDDLRLQAF